MKPNSRHQRLWAEIVPVIITKEQNPVLRMGRLSSGTWPPQMTWPENTAQEQADAGGALNLITVLGYQTQP